MAEPELDSRTPERRTRDEQIAAQPHMAPPDLPPNTPALPVEAYLGHNGRRPMAVPGIVENGLVRTARSRGETGRAFPRHHRRFGGQVTSCGADDKGSRKGQL